MLMQSAVLIALLFLLDLALRKRVRATIRYAVWMLALVKLALPPSLASPTAVAYWLSAKTAGVYSAPTLTPAMTPEVNNVNTTYKATSELREMALVDKGWPELTWQAVFFVVWLAVSSGVGIWVIWRARVVIGIMRESAEAPEALRSLLEACRRQLGIKRAIQVRCAEIGSPAICGALRPIILIPPTLAENLSSSEMRSVLLHELAHHKRSDLWVNHMQVLLQVLYWYNPLLWLANASIRHTREQAVDEMVLVEMGEEAQAYPVTLLHVAKLGLGRPLASMGLMGILEPGRGLTQRILHIMNRPLPRTARIGVRGVVAVLLLALVVVPMACRPRTEHVGDDSSPSEILQSALKTYASLSNYSDTGKAIFIARGKTLLTTTLSTRLARPNLYRIECEQVEIGGVTNHGAVWSDGNGDFRMLNNFTQKVRDGINALSMSTAISQGASSTIPGAFFSYRMGGGLMPSLESVLTREKDEKLGATDCYVLSTSPDTRNHYSKTTIWIGKRDHLLYQAQGLRLDSVATEIHENIEVNKPFLKSDFAR
jgi:beta-lactamase regulating signal transducer with metallopeptidase domain